MNRSHTTIARELQRNKHLTRDHEYHIYTRSHEKAMGRRSKAHRKTQFGQEPWSQVECLIPGVSNYLRIIGMTSLRHETICQYIYKEKRCGWSLYMHLRLRCRKGMKRYHSKESRGTQRGKAMVEERPHGINDRSTEGHWGIACTELKNIREFRNTADVQQHRPPPEYQASNDTSIQTTHQDMGWGGLMVRLNLETNRSVYCIHEPEQTTFARLPLGTGIQP